MSKNLVPIARFPVAEALPEYVPAERIGVDVDLIGKIARWGCFKPTVELTAYDGETTKYNVGIVGTNGDGSAMAARSALVSRAPLARCFIEDDDSKQSTPQHRVLPLTISSNIPEMRQRLGGVHANLRHPKPWARQFDASIGYGLRHAARVHLLSGEATRREGSREAFNVFSFAMGVWAIDAMRSALTKEPSSLDWKIGMGLVLLAVPSAMKFGAMRDNADPREVCFSAIPGYHIDRYAAVWGLTKGRRLVRPIK